MNYLIDKTVFEARGEYGCSNSDYNLVRTTCCGKFAVEDDELLQLYCDPEDLSKVVQLFDVQSCPLCQSSEWELKEVESQTDMPKEWAWAKAKE